MVGMLRAGAVLAFIAAAGAALAEPASFDTPDSAVAALIAALEAADRDAVLAIFGPEHEDLLSTGNAEEDRELWSAFLADAKARSRIEADGEDRATLIVGRRPWPFPTPLVRDDAGWSFDAEAGREEVLMREIGRNELAVIEIMRRAGEIQAAYRQTDHDGDGVMEFAASILSSPGERDGLYWQDASGAEPSPFDDQIARASLTGYSIDGEHVEPSPYHGYFFRILQGQSEGAPGGAYSYMLGGNMVAGHALVAYPASYGDTGIMSFMVGENGIVYETDLGAQSLERGLAIDLYDPGADWTPVD